MPVLELEEAGKEDFEGYTEDHWLPVRIMPVSEIAKELELSEKEVRNYRAIRQLTDLVNGENYD